MSKHLTSSFHKKGAAGRCQDVPPRVSEQAPEELAEPAHGHPEGGPFETDDIR